MSVDFTLLLPEFLVAGLAFLVLTVDFFLPPHRRNGVTASVTAVGMVGLALFSALFLQGKSDSLYQGVFLVDSFSTFFKAFFLVLGAGVVLMSVEFVRKHLTHPGEFYALITLSVLAMMLMAAAGELLTAYISLELLSFTLYVLVSFAREDPRSNEAGTKYILLGAFSSGLLLYGISLVYGSLGTTHYLDIATRLFPSQMAPTTLAGLALIVAGLGFKMAAVPFHMWAPDIYEGAPTPVTAHLAVASKAAVFALVLRLFSQAFIPALDQWQIIVAILAAITMTVGNLVAITQHNIKRLLAYSSIAQVGYLLVGVAALSHAASNAIILHLAGYAFSNLAAFMVVIVYFNLTGKEEIKEFAGLGQRHPFAAMVMAAALFSLAGLPFFAGFITKFYLFTAAAQAGLLWLAGLAITNSLISLYYYLVVIRQMYIEKPEDAAPLRVPVLSMGVLALLVAGVFFVGVYPRPLVDVIQNASEVILPAVTALAAGR
ncbi:MAG: NADH-quinone oxidoreductase subunit N [Chloroflexi bacterium]|nr:NADH-quinone oxidoreductase subunit N [Chloroflexota bacterium]